MHITSRRNTTGFTIVELLIVVVVVGILAAISLVTYSGIQQNAAASVLKSDLKNASTQLDLAKVQTGAYPVYDASGSGLSKSDGTTFEYTKNGDSYCLTAWSNAAKTSFYISNTTGDIREGVCDGHTGYSGDPGSGGSPIAYVSAGHSYTCAAIDGEAYCWGRNNYGQLGNNTTTDSSVPIAVSPGSLLENKNVTHVSSGERHTCAIADGKAYCWGYGANGRLGNNSTSDSSTPVAVHADGLLAGKTVTAIDAGSSHTCAIADGKAYCWGYNYYGQLGNDSSLDSVTPVGVSTEDALSGRTVTAISAGLEHTCAIADGKAYCWGRGTQGRLGNNATLNSDIPVAVNTVGVLSGKTVTSIAAGSSHTCAVADGKAYCWGDGSMSQLGNGGTSTYNVPMAVSTSGVLSGKTVTSVSAGQHTCAIAEDQAYCWGAGSHGRLGNNDTIDSNTPVEVFKDGALSGKSVTGISAGSIHTCAVADSGVYCWGYGGHGRLGNNDTVNSSVPVPTS